jgi:hypothetical protein
VGENSDRVQRLRLPQEHGGCRVAPAACLSNHHNVKLYHVLIDGCATLNLISLAAFKKLQIPMGKLQPSHPFSRVGLVSVMLRGCISLPVTFRMAESFHTESVLFDVAEVSLPFNVILGRPTLYQFMAVAHYGHPVLKMSSPNDVLKIWGDCDTRACALEKLQALAAAHEAAAEHGGKDPTPLSLHQHGSVSAPHVQPSAKEDVPVKIVQIGVEAGHTTHVSGDLDSK